MERKTRFELATSSLARRHSTAELLPLAPDGAEGQDRTGDTRIFSPLLYRLSYLGTFVIVAQPRWFEKTDRNKRISQPDHVFGLANLSIAAGEVGHYLQASMLKAWLWPPPPNRAQAVSCIFMTSML